MRSHFDEQLAQLNRELTEMGALCEEAIALAAKSLVDCDKTLAARIAPLDGEIDQKERGIECLCLKLLLQQQPVARDLRQISAALKMITDMERIGDQAEDIAENRVVSPAQATLAKEVAAYLTENMYEKITLDRLAGRFHVSASAIKTSFKAVYGVSFYSYIKTQKMESAAYMLEYTDKTVLDIANEHGYDNSSKFAVAFRSVKGIAPAEYRIQNSKL